MNAVPYEGERFVAVLAGLFGGSFVLIGAWTVWAGSPGPGLIVLLVGLAPLAWIAARSRAPAARERGPGDGSRWRWLPGIAGLRAMVVAAGVATVAAGWAIVLLHPPLVGDAATAVAALSRETVLTSAAVAILLLHLVVLARARLRRTAARDERAGDESGGDVGGGVGGGVGGEVRGTASLEPPLVAGGEDVLAALDDGAYEEAAEEVTEELRSAAVDAVARARGVERDAAEAAVDAGDWTSDRRAAAFVGRDVRWDRWTVLRDWLAPEHRVERWIRRSVAAIAAVDPVDRGGGGGEDERTDTAFVDDEEPEAAEEAGGGRGDAATVDIPGGAGERRPSWPVKFAAVALAAAGMLMSEALVLLATIVPLAFIAVGGVAEVPPATVRVERRIEDGSPDVGERTTVALTATNVGDRTVADLRATDRVPEDAAVVEGEPEIRAALRPGESATVRYQVVLDGGGGDFEGVDVTVGSLGGRWRAHERAAVATPVEPRSEINDLPLRPGSATIHGRRPTDAPGHGNEFYGVRDYRPGDPLHRIDWNRLAKTGELEAIQYRARTATRTVVVVDLTAELPADGETDATTTDMVRAATFAAVRWASRVGDDVAILVVGRARSGWMAPRPGPVQRPRLEEVFRTFGHTDGTPMDGLASRGLVDGVVEDPAATVDRVRPTARIVSVTPGVGDEISGLVRRFDAKGNPVAVILAALGDHGGALDAAARVRRWRTADEASRRGAGVVVWRYGDPLALATARATEAQEP